MDSLPDPPLISNVLAFIFLLVILILGLYTFVNNAFPGYSYYQQLLLPPSENEAIPFYIEPNREGGHNKPSRTLLMPSEVDFSVVTVVSNCQDRVTNLLEKLHQSFKDFVESGRAQSYEIIIVDNASKDQTVDHIIEFANNHENIYLLKIPVEICQPQALLTGILHARGKRIFHFYPFLGIKLRDFMKMNDYMDKLYEINPKVVICGVWPLTKNVPELISTTLGKFITWISTKLFASLNIEGTAICRSHCFLTTREAAVNIYPNIFTYGHSIEIEILHLGSFTGATVVSYENYLVHEPNVQMESIDRLYEVIILAYICIIYKTGLHRVRKYKYKL